ncbi:hypothetical protein AMTRI_Chr01g114750 [Amborella trichopoda]|uniref:Bifunctional inhibitor/plant lipid transfer protein/seed storage helical domain-containing protein n=1 Tax=Amborella trichopoda TaxID=13333 RepID=W1PY13_AMBTC|nr:protein catecholamines up [Amborella trichopoda]ERN12360.1 hypothetical protein AMTR_s00025p00092990 [Amborella trichopoda]|eukprot:XP_006850779.1 protein catecholamines up [Amborella trichopoda]
MDSRNILALVLISAHLILIARCVDEPRPLCISQFALASSACALIPFNPPTDHSHDHDHDHDHDDHHHDHHHHHDYGHHGHHHDHGHHRRHHASSCCRWLRQIDNACVCHVLNRLPVFLSKPSSSITLTPDEYCSVTYRCPRV